jgi:hypothetical protein
MEPQRTRFDEFVSEYLRLNPRDNLGFYYIDCTSITDGYAPLKKLTGWAEVEGAAATSLIHGWGELVWMEQGRVLHVERILNFRTISQLLQKTEGLLRNNQRG